ncbi:MAG: hypothetical protein ACQUHE_00580 [Bacteroidia bacterium]
MNKEENKKSEQPLNYQEPLPKDKVDEGDKAVKKPEDEVYIKESAMAKTKDPAKQKENSEQPVHSVKK